MDEEGRDTLAAVAKLMALMRVRNTKFEDIDAGIVPVSRSGDYSDVVVVDADGRHIAWLRASHFDDDAMAGMPLCALPPAPVRLLAHSPRSQVCARLDNCRTCRHAAPVGVGVCGIRRLAGTVDLTLAKPLEMWRGLSSVRQTAWRMSRGCAGGPQGRGAGAPARLGIGRLPGRRRSAFGGLTPGVARE